MAQNTVSRMIIGGSAGLRMMIALPRAAPPTFSMRPRGRLGELVDVGPRARPGRPRRDRRDDLRVGHRRDPRDRVHDRDRRLPAAGDHVDVRRVEVLIQVDRRADERADAPPGSGRPPDARLARTAARWPGGPGRGGLEHQVGQLVRPSSQSTPRPRPRPRARAPGQTIGRRVDADHVRTSTRSLRRSLTSRSVPMLPGPTIAADAFLMDPPGKTTEGEPEPAAAALH